MLGTTSQYQITEAVVISLAVDIEVDISRHIIALDLFENINFPYITGTILVSDDNDLFTGKTLKFTGSETLLLQLDVPLLGGGRYTITKEFIMYEIDSMSPANDRASLVKLNLIEKHAFVDQFKPFSKSYTGSPYSIISKILSDETLLDITSTLSDLRATDDPVQEPMKVTIPYWTPLQAVEWLRSRCTTKNGSPYFLFSTIHGDVMWWMSLDSMLRQPAWNADAPFVESVAFSQSTPNWTTPEFRTIVKKSNRGSHRSLDAAEMGALGSNITYSNISTNTSTSVDYSIADTLVALNADNILSDNTAQNLYNPYTTLTETKIHKLKSRYFHQIGLRTYNDHNNYFDDDSRSKIKGRVQNLADRVLLNMNKISIEIPGFNFMGGLSSSTQAGVGDITSIILSGNNSAEDTFSSRDEIIDIDRSGNYLTTALRHTFAGGRISTSLDGCKLVENYTELQ